MLVIGVEGNPHSGMFSPFRGEDDPVTKENYERRRVQLWRENWSDVKLPALEEIASAYVQQKPG